MTRQEVEFLGIKVGFEVPSTVEEYDKAAGRQNAALDDAITYTIYHGVGGEFRDKFCEAVEAETQIAWPVDAAATERQPKRKDGTVANVHISPGKYFPAVCKQLGVQPTHFQDLANRIASSIKFDPSEGSRGGRVGKEFIAAAEAVVARGDEVIDATVSKLEGLNPGLTVARDEAGKVNAEALARAIKVNADRKAKEAMAEISV